MGRGGTQAVINRLLIELTRHRGFRGAIVCTDQGLLVGSVGDVSFDEVLAGFASLFDAIVARGARDLELRHIDEVSVLDRQRGRIVVRPVARGPERSLFLVCVLDHDATWRRATTGFLRVSAPLFQRVIDADAHAPEDLRPEAM